MSGSRIFKTKWFQRFAEKEGIEDAALAELIGAAERGQIDADLGSGLCTLRLARPSEGKSGGYRAFVAFRCGKLAVFLFAFAKKDRANLNAEELKMYRKLAKAYLGLSAEQIQNAQDKGEMMEVKNK